MSFAGAEDVMAVVERCVGAAWRHATGEHRGVGQAAWPRMAYTEAMRRFGTDKPDTRFGMELQALPELGRGVAAVVLRCAGEVRWTPADTRSLRRRLLGGSDAAVGGAPALGVVRVRGEGDYKGDALPGGHDAVCRALQNLHARAGDTVFVGHTELQGSARLCDHRAEAAVQTLLGRVRLALAGWRREHQALAMPTEPHLLWVSDFPLFEQDEAGAWSAMHHPFTAPLADDIEKLRAGDLAGLTGQCYDLVCNGTEVGGGSVRIHDANLQRCVLQDVLRMPSARVDSTFGHLLESLASGCPPHAGFALGIDRLVSLVVGAERAPSIRDVIAFPKSYAGQEPLTGAPTDVGDDALREFGLQTLRPK